MKPPQLKIFNNQLENLLFSYYRDRLRIYKCSELDNELWSQLDVEVSEKICSQVYSQFYLELMNDIS